MENYYVHGYSDRESERLFDQAGTLAKLLHHDTFYPPGSKVLEAGCGVGAQTILLAKGSPQAQIISIDASEESVEQARVLVERKGIVNVSLQVADIFDLPFCEESFDHLFVCFVLEHLQKPLDALACLKKVLKSNGSITVIEGDHGSTYFHPRSVDALHAIQCLVDVQARLGGDALIGRRLYPLLEQAGFKGIEVTPRMVYVDSSKPELVEGFTRNTFIAMVEGARDDALAMGLTTQEAWEKGISDLYRTTRSDGVFCYTFFKGVAIKQ
jgi:SAM-dependent methyltransferase